VILSQMLSKNIDETPKTQKIKIKIKIKMQL
jgi:hypothetical protein